MASYYTNFHKVPDAIRGNVDLRLLFNEMVDSQRANMDVWSLESYYGKIIKDPNQIISDCAKNVEQLINDLNKYCTSKFNGGPFAFNKDILHTYIGEAVAYFIKVLTTSALCYLNTLNILATKFHKKDFKKFKLHKAIRSLTAYNLLYQLEPVNHYKNNVLISEAIISSGQVFAYDKPENLFSINYPAADSVSYLVSKLFQLNEMGILYCMLQTLKPSDPIMNFLRLCAYTISSDIKNDEFMENIYKFRVNFKESDGQNIAELMKGLTTENESLQISELSLDGLLIAFAKLRKVDASRKILICQSILTGIQTSSINEPAIATLAEALLEKQQYIEALMQCALLTNTDEIKLLLKKLILLTKISSIDYILNSWVSPFLRKYYLKVLKTDLKQQNNLSEPNLIEKSLDLTSDFGAIIFCYYYKIKDFRNAVKYAFIKNGCFEAILMNGKQLSAKLRQQILRGELKMYCQAQKAMENVSEPFIEYQSAYIRSKRSLSNVMNNQAPLQGRMESIRITQALIKTKITIVEARIRYPSIYYENDNEFLQRIIDADEHRCAIRIGESSSSLLSMCIERAVQKCIDISLDTFACIDNHTIQYFIKLIETYPNQNIAIAKCLINCNPNIILPHWLIKINKKVPYDYERMLTLCIDTKNIQSAIRVIYEVANAELSINTSKLTYVEKALTQKSLDIVDQSPANENLLLEFQQLVKRINQDKII